MALSEMNSFTKASGHENWAHEKSIYIFEVQMVEIIVDNHRKMWKLGDGFI